jgi:hypothetical protein
MFGGMITPCNEDSRNDCNEETSRGTNCDTSGLRGREWRWTISRSSLAGRACRSVVRRGTLRFSIARAACARRFICCECRRRAPSVRSSARDTVNCGGRKETGGRRVDRNRCGRGFQSLDMGGIGSIIGRWWNPNGSRWNRRSTECNAQLCCTGPRAISAARNTGCGSQGRL